MGSYVPVKEMSASLRNCINYVGRNGCSIECFHSRGQHICKSIVTKEAV